MSKIDRVMEITAAIGAFRLAKMKVSRLGMPAVDKLLVKAETLLANEAVTVKKALWEDPNHGQPRGREDGGEKRRR
jgi:hypothetical protein